MISLEHYGWNNSWQTVWEEQGFTHYTPARVIAEYGSKYVLATPDLVSASLLGALAHKTPALAMPKVGDWVAVEVTEQHLSMIHAVLPRRSEITRGGATSALERQVIASNVDIAFIVQPLDLDFSPERLERYLFQLSSQPIKTVILLNKADTAPDSEAKQAALQHLNVEVVTISALNPNDIQKIEQLIPVGNTAVFMGSSGVGKSTLTNKLLGTDHQKTQEIRTRDAKGRHTTVHRELFVLPSGGIVIDMPGVRAVRLWGNMDDLYESFPEIAVALRSCRFPRCTHTSEEGCAVKEGLQNGTIDPLRYTRFKALQEELSSLEEKRQRREKQKAINTREHHKRARLRKQQQEKDADALDWYT